MRIPLLLFFFFVVCSCRQGRQLPRRVDTAGFNWSVTEAPDWSALFIRDKGWLGGDGIFMTTADGREQPGSGKGKQVTMWFSDTQLGAVDGDSLSAQGAAMIHNSSAFLDSGLPDPSALHYAWDSLNGVAAPLFTPATPLSTPEDYYWLADGFVNAARANDLFLFGERVTPAAGNEGFGFRITGNTLIRVPAGKLKKPAPAQQSDLPFFAGLNQDSTGIFGIGVLVNTREAGMKNGDGFVYVYGARKGQLIVARVRPAAIDDFSAWRFRTGNGWSKSPAKIKPVTDHVSNELSMTPLEDGRYLLVFQVDGLAPMVAFRLAASPAGPFGPLTIAYETKDSIARPATLYSYNAKAHPVISRPGELLISYNVNSTNYPNDIVHFPHLYRPRFLRLKYHLVR